MAFNPGATAAVAAASAARKAATAAGANQKMPTTHTTASRSDSASKPPRHLRAFTVAPSARHCPPLSRRLRASLTNSSMVASGAVTLVLIPSSSRSPLCVSYAWMIASSTTCGVGFLASAASVAALLRACCASSSSACPSFSALDAAAASSASLLTCAVTRSTRSSCMALPVFLYPPQAQQPTEHDRVPFV